MKDIEFLEDMKFRESESKTFYGALDFKSYCIHLRNYVKVLFPMNGVPQYIIDAIDEFEMRCYQSDQQFDFVIKMVIDNVNALDGLE